MKTLSVYVRARVRVSERVRVRALRSTLFKGERERRKKRVRRNKNVIKQ
jgi:hypothetical protein